MSTAYYPFRDSISSARLSEGPGHDVIGVWQRGAKMGELVCTKGTGKSIIAMFREDEAAFHTSAGGDLLGVVVVTKEKGHSMKLDEYLLSEYGELFTVEQVLKLGGTGRKLS